MQVVLNNSYNNVNLMPDKEALIESLPLDIFHRILSKLDDTNIQSVTLVSRFWKDESLDIAKQEEFKLINDLLNFIREKFPKAEKSKHFTVDNNTILGSVNPLQLKSSIRENILEILSDLETSDLELLESTFKGRSNRNFYEILFDVARIYKEIDVEVDKAKKIISFYARHNALKDIIVKLLNKRYFDKAVKVVLDISDQLPGYIFCDISKKLMKNGKIDGALKVALKISEENIFKRYALEYICEKLSKNGNVIKLLIVIPEITDFDKKKSLLSQILWGLKRSEKVDIAAEIIIQASTYIDCKDYILEVVSKKLMQNGNITKAADIAFLMLDFDKQSRILANISKQLMQSEDVDGAVDIALKISNNTFKNSALEYICKKLAENGNVTKLFSVIHEITLDKRHFVFEQIVWGLVKSEKFVIVAEIIIQKPRIFNLKHPILEVIAKKLMQNENIIKAVDIALLMLDFDKQGKILKDISKQLMKSEDVDGATRDKILEDISMTLGKNRKVSCTII